MSKSRNILIARVIAAIISLLIVIGLLPVAALSGSDAKITADNRRFDSILNLPAPEGYSETMANPYGYPMDQNFLFAEHPQRVNKS